MWPRCRGRRLPVKLTGAPAAPAPAPAAGGPDSGGGGPPLSLVVDCSLQAAPDSTETRVQAVANTCGCSRKPCCCVASTQQTQDHLRPVTYEPREALFSQTSMPPSGRSRSTAPDTPSNLQPILVYAPASSPTESVPPTLYVPVPWSGGKSVPESPAVQYILVQAPPDGAPPPQPPTRPAVPSHAELPPDIQLQPASPVLVSTQSLASKKPLPQADVTTLPSQPPTQPTPLPSPTQPAPVTADLAPTQQLPPPQIPPSPVTDTQPRADGEVQPKAPPPPPSTSPPADSEVQSQAPPPPLPTSSPAAGVPPAPAPPPPPSPAVGLPPAPPPPPPAAGVPPAPPPPPPAAGLPPAPPPPPPAAVTSPARDQVSATTAPSSNQETGLQGGILGGVKLRKTGRLETGDAAAPQQKSAQPAPKEDLQSQIRDAVARRLRINEQGAEQKETLQLHVIQNILQLLQVP